MDSIKVWDWFIFAVAGYVAVSSLTRLMILHRDAYTQGLREKYEQEQREREAKARAEQEALEEKQAGTGRKREAA